MYTPKEKIPVAVAYKKQSGSKVWIARRKQIEHNSKLSVDHLKKFIQGEDLRDLKLRNSSILTQASSQSVVETQFKCETKFENF